MALCFGIAGPPTFCTRSCGVIGVAGVFSPDDSQSTKDPIRSLHTMVSTPYRVDALTLCPKTCHRFSYTLVCRADLFARFRAIRTISSSGCWYCIAVLTSLWPIVFITAARFPVLFSTRVP